MPYKKKAIPGTVQFNKLIEQLPEKRENIKSQVQYRHDFLESQKRVNYQSEFDRLQGAKKLSALDPNVKNRMRELKKKTKQSLTGGGDTHRIYSTKF